jgi:two-component system, NtrC family, nitrogen regulation sensor histidine kinase GlnL
MSAPPRHPARGAMAAAGEDAVLARALEALQTPVMLLDATLAVSYVNPAAEVALATSVRQLRGSPVAQWFESDELVPALRLALRDHQPILQRHLRVRTHDARTFETDCWATPTAGRAAALVIEFASGGAGLEGPDDSLEAQRQYGQVVLRGLAHEIKNPLGGLRGAAQLLERELADPALREYTHVIIGEADRLRRLVDRMLAPAATPLARTRLNVHEVLERVRRLVESEVDGLVAIETDYDPSLPELLGDREQLMQVLLNLVRNAVQALTETGQMDGRIVLRTRARHRVVIGARRHRLALCVEVVDNGPGVPAAMRVQIFLPLVTGRAGGTGLGLSVAHALVAQHGGSIECESEPGHTVFTVLLPVNGEGA